MALNRIIPGNRSRTTYEFFSGKGGVGKTTLSAAHALYLAKQGKEVLIISTDPAHSLSDSFDMEIGPEETQVREGLEAVEISPEKAVEDFQEKVSGEPEMMAGMDMFGGGEGEDVGGLTSMTPGIDEMAAFDRFIQYMHCDDYDYIIFDTAPTGHALRFLSLPDVMESWVGKLLVFRKKMSKFTGMFKGFLPFTEDEKWEDNSLEALENLKERIKEARSIMQDTKKTRFWLVLIPEEMSLFEGKRMVNQLEKYGIECGKVIVNKITPENEGCTFCSKKRRQQLEVLEEIRKEYRDKEIRTLNLHEMEIRGFKLLEDVGSELYE